MKRLLLLLFLAFSLNGFAQRIKLVEGDASVLKGQKSLNFEFVYDGITIGRKSQPEKDYIIEKKAKYNEKEPGKGDAWEKDWSADRAARYEPRFIESYAIEGLPANKTSEYTLIFATTTIEPGYNIGISRQNAYIDGVATLVATGDKSKVIAKWTIDNAPGRVYGGYDFDTGLRIQECYATAGKRLGIFVSKSLK